MGDVVVQLLYALRLRCKSAQKAWTVAGIYDQELR